MVVYLVETAGLRVHRDLDGVPDGAESLLSQLGGVSQYLAHPMSPLPSSSLYPYTRL
jgi:hypothetical protein